MFFRKKKKDEPITYPFGFEAAPQPTTQLSSRALVCLSKGLIIFMAAFGAIGGVITSFSLPCHLVLIFFGLLIMALALAFIHYNRWVFNLGYPVLFILFVFFIITFRFQVNSGYQAFLSIMQEEYSTHFNLSILRQAEEAIQNRTLTITYASLFIGFFLLILLNIAVSEYMSLIFVVLLTFPIFQLGIYIDLMPNMICFIFLLASYFMTGTLKRSEHFLLPYHDKKFTEFKYTKKKETITHRYHASGKTFTVMALQFTAFAVLMGLLSIPMLLSSNASAQISDARKVADKYVQNFTQGGLSSFFNRYEAKGGISNGKLGGVSSVRPDFETDLTITFVPFSYETLYLKAFTGGEYSDNRWLKPTYNTDEVQEILGEKFDTYPVYTAFLESRRLENYMRMHNDIGMKAKMEIKNVDANEDCLYLPYYTAQSIDTDYTTYESIPTGKVALGDSYSFWYYPYPHGYWPLNKSPDGLRERYGDDHIYTKFIKQYDAFCFNSYKNVPSDISEYLQTLHEDIGTADTASEQIVMIQQFLERNYKYDMQPGTTPYRQDFVKYFLETQKKGYCAHFASAATLLLRSYNIPTRYVEGYTIRFSDVSEGTNTDEALEDWFVGNVPIEKTGVITVDIPDARAHAWVEVYEIGMGWVPYEFTPPATSDEDTDVSDFWSIFSDLLSTRPSNRNDNDVALQETAEQLANNKTVRRIGNSFLMPFFQFVVILIVLACIAILLRKLIRFSKLQSAYKNGNYALLFSEKYTQIVKQMMDKNLLLSSVLLPSELATITSDKVLSRLKDKDQHLVPSIEEIDQQMALLEVCCYSKDNITREQADALLAFLKRYKKVIGKV